MTESLQIKECRSLIQQIVSTIGRNQLQACLGLLDLIDEIQDPVRCGTHGVIFANILDPLQKAFSELMTTNPELAKRYLTEALERLVDRKKGVLGAGEA